MFASQLGIRLILWIGATVPTPAPYEVMTALESAEVTNDAETGDGFQLTFGLRKDKTLDFAILTSGIIQPHNRVIVAVLAGVVPEVLIDGVISHHQLEPSGEGNSRLTVTGHDLRVMLDLEEKNAKYENQPDFVIVSRLLLGYPQLGLIPAVTPTTDVPLIIDRIPRQQETDLKFIERLAQRNGYVFYIEPKTFGVNMAYWGPQPRLGLPQPALTQNMGAASNVKSLNFAQDALEPVAAEGSFVEPFAKLSLPIPSLPSLKIPPLAASPTPAQRTVKVRTGANKNPATAATTALATATNAPDAVTGEGELDAVRYGTVLRARRLVGVRGAGLSYDGFYYVRGVTHEIARGKYVQKFRISREGTGTLTPVVVP
jgi:hypothetical protein